MKKELLYIRIASVLENQISNEVLRVGDRLPSLRVICQEYGVSMNTATQAYLELERKGLIESRPQSGFYISTALKRKLSIPNISKPEISSQNTNTETLVRKVYRTLNDHSITR